MNYVVFANVGTSIIGNYRRALDDRDTSTFDDQLHALKSGVEPCDMTKTGHDLPGAELLETLFDYAVETGPETSAEYKSTAEIIADYDGVAPDALYLFATDTVDGVLSARVQQRVFAELHSDISRIEVVRVEGLQVDDGARFTRQGLPAYITKLYDRLRIYPAHSHRRVFNPTGGFKSVVPYMTIVAMLEDCETRYIFERSDALIDLRPLPVNFDEELVNTALPLLERGASGEEFRADELENELSLNEPLYRSPHAAFWTNLAGEFIPSGLGNIVHERYRSKTDEIWISAQARSELEEMGPDRRRDVMPGIRKLQRSDTRRMATREKYKTGKTDTDCVGQSSMLYRVHYVEERRENRPVVKIVRVFHTDWKHDERDRLLNGPGIFSDTVGGWEPFDFDDHL